MPVNVTLISGDEMKKKNSITIAILLLIGTYICTGCSSKSGPEDVYKQYINSVPSADKFTDLDIFFPADRIAKRKNMILKLKTKRNKTENEVLDAMLRMAKRIEKCVDNRKIIKKTVTDNKARITYSFKDVCSEQLIKDNPEMKGAITATIEDVDFVYEDGWKLSSRSPRPEKPVKIRKKIDLTTK